VLDDTDYRLAEDAARQALIAATTQARQTESDRQRLEALKLDGSVSRSDEEKAQSAARTASATAEAAARQLELARNRVKYTALRASQAGVVTAVRLEVGHVVAEGLPMVSIANESEPEIVVDVPEDHLADFRASRFKAWLASAPDQAFDVVLRELSPQAAAQTRTFRARLKPATPRLLPLGTTATLAVERPMAQNEAATIPAAAITQDKGQPAVWVARRAGDGPVGVVELAAVTVRGYRNDEVLISGPPAGALVVTAGVQKMAPGLKVALPIAAAKVETKRASQ
jgi:RND family efflux transporter MFP subunit